MESFQRGLIDLSIIQLLNDASRFTDKNATTYRPSNEDCLMRAVATPNFCKVCLEGLWLSLLRRVNLIDGIKEDCQKRTLGRLVKIIEAQLIPLAHLRFDTQEFAAKKESYTIIWQKDGQTLDKFTNKTVLEIGDNQIPANYTLLVSFATDEVRRDHDGLLKSRREINILERCSM